MKTHKLTGLQRYVLLCSIAGVMSGVPAVSSAAQLSFASQQQPAITCSQLTGFSVSAAQIGKPTTGAQVISAVLMPASGSGSTALGEYCKVLANIKPVTVGAPDIQVMLNLPTAWNRKSMMFGGGGFDGIFVFINQVHAGLAAQVTPQARGYAVFGSDGGHKLHLPFNIGRDGSFAVNDEALNNYASEALKKTHDTAMIIINAYYGSHPEKSYFHGGSNGGREALMVAQKWPHDYDGVIAAYPAMSLTGLLLQGGRVGRALAVPGAYLNDAKRRLVRDAGIAACDSLDGVADGIISNVAECKKWLHGAPGAAMIAALRCPGGGDTGDSCLSDVQLQMLQTVQTPIHYHSPLPSGEKSYPGSMIWGSDWGILSSDPNVSVLLPLGLNLAPPSFPYGADQPWPAVFYDQWMRYFIARDPNLDSLQIDPQHPGIWENRINGVAHLIDASSPDLHDFHARGGKLLMLQGQADMTVASASTDRYFRRVQEEMGTQAVHHFMRYYRVPGYAHSTSANFNAGWDSITVLENWVEHGMDPGAQVVEDKTGVPGRTRPLCEYPAWPQYTGSGSVNLAASFRCAGGHDDGDDDDHRGNQSGDDSDDGHDGNSGHGRSGKNQ